MYGSINSGVVRAKSAGVGNALKSAGVARLTDTSVHCADRMVARSSSCGTVQLSSQCASG